MMKTELLKYTEHDESYQITVKYGLDYDFAKKANQAPYFSLTADIRRRAGNGRWVDWGGGSCHDEIVKHFPHLAFLVQWHLVSTKGPLHYLTNAKYWWERANGISQWSVESYEKPAEFSKYFQNTIVWGSISEDTSAELEKLMAFNDEPGRGWNYVARALVAREPLVMVKFHETMKSLDLLEEPVVVPV